MKKIFTSFWALIIGVSIYANPIPVPLIEISELFFDESNNWKLELLYYNVDPDGLTFDSIFLYSTIDTVQLPSYRFTESIGLLVVTADSLDYEFKINRHADTIKMVSYSLNGHHLCEDILIFGNLPGASISYPRQGQSISKYNFFYIKDKSPSIGFFNDTLGMCGTISGIVFDKYSKPVKNRKFILDNYFETFENGEYSTRVYSKPATYNRIDYKAGNTQKSASITEFSYTMEPDSVIKMDIYLLDTLATEIIDINISNTPISIYPNPVSKGEELKINIDLPIITSEIFVEIIDLNGKMIKKKKINHKSSSIKVPDESGVYIIRTTLDSKVISLNRIIVNE